MSFWRNRPILVVCAVLVGLGGTTAHAVEFAAHRALYTMTLVEARTGSGIAGVNGEMAVEWRNACSGWTFEYRSVIDIEFSEEKPLRLTSSATTWESRDGKDYRFSVRHKANGVDTERIEGTAVSHKEAKTGHVVFSHPEKARITLPAGTLFPIAHSTAIMRALKRGNKPVLVSRMVFDGMDAKGLYQVNAAIGHALEKDGGGPPLDASMKGMKPWPVELAYFAAGSKAPEPDHEIKMQLYANGVADDMIMEFADFTIRARIGRAELLPEPSCR